MIFSLENWRAQNKAESAHWFAALAELEARMHYWAIYISTIRTGFSFF